MATAALGAVVVAVGGEEGSRKLKNEGAVQCGRALGVLKLALAWLYRPR